MGDGIYGIVNLMQKKNWVYVYIIEKHQAGYAMRNFHMILNLVHSRFLYDQICYGKLWLSQCINIVVPAILLLAIFPYVDCST